MGLQWPSKRVEALGERKFRDIVGILPRPGHLRDTSGTRPKYPGLSRPFRDGWQLCRGLVTCVSSFRTDIRAFCQYTLVHKGTKQYSNRKYPCMDSACSDATYQSPSMYACIKQVSHCIAFSVYKRSTLIIVPVYVI